MKTEGKKGNRYEYMTKTPVEKLIISLAIPTIISMLVTGIYSSADTYFIGQIHNDATKATAAVGLMFPVMAIIQAMGFMFGHGSGNFLSRMLGAGKKEEASKMASTGFALALIVGIIIAVFGNIFINQIVGFLASKDMSVKTTEMAVVYGRIILIGAPFMMCQFVVNNQLRYQGSAVYAMVGLLAGAIINIFLDPILILLLDMGIMGAAIATVIGQVISFVILIVGSMTGENIKLRLSDVAINRYYITEVINGGAPSLFRQGLASVATILLNKAAGNAGGEAAIAAMSIVTRVMMLLLSSLIGFGQGYQPVCSFNYGAGLKKRVKDGYYFCIKWGTIFLICIAVLCFVYAPSIIGFFRNDSEVIKIGAKALRFQAVIFPINSVIIMTNMMLQSMGKGIKASITSSARNGICFIPVILILPHFLGLTGVQMTQPLADTLTLLITIPFAVSELKKLKEDTKANAKSEETV